MKITQQEWEEYIQIKRQLDLVNKVEGRIIDLCINQEESEGFDSGVADSRKIEIDNDRIVVKVSADCFDFVFEIPKEKVVE